MDRSTHPLLSPSSATNRLSLIQASRIKRSASSGTTTSIGYSPAVSQRTGYNSAGSDASSFDVGTPTGPPESSSQLMSLAQGLVGKDLINPSTEHLFSDACTMDSSSKISFQYSGSSAGRSTNDGIDSFSSLQSFDHHSSVSGFSGAPLFPRKKDDARTGAKALSVGGTDGGGVQITRTDSTASTMSGTTTGVADTYENKSIFVSHQDSSLQACFDAMDFIPTIECPRRAVADAYEHKRTNILLQARIAVATPIFTACYTQHGGSSILAVEGLTKLLNDTDFFLPDLSSHGDPLTSTRLTLLDMAIQVVCDVANSSARETCFLPCIEFVSEAVFYSRCNLNSRTIGYVVRFYLFIFYFGASVPTPSSWPRFSSPSLKDGCGLDAGNDTVLLDEEELGARSGHCRMGYVPGGAPQAAALALKELVTLHLGRLRCVVDGDTKEGGAGKGGEGIGVFIDTFVSSLVDSAIHQVDVANYTQLALHQIHRSGGSELFWHDMMTSCGVGLFTLDKTSMDASMKDIYITSFAILSSIVKVASGKVRKISNSTQYVPRDVASKLLSVELILHFLQQWSSKVKDLQPKPNDKNQKPTDDAAPTKQPEAIGTMAYIVRRLIVPCLLSNTKAGLEDIRIFRRMMKIVTELWCTQYYRQHIKIEIGVLIEHFVLKFLRLGPQVLSPKRLSSTSSLFLQDLPNSLLPQQVSILTEVKAWFATEPRDILELYLNFDQVDAHASKKHFRLLPSTHWKITQQLCGALCTLAEQCTDIVSEQIRLTRIDLACVESSSSGGMPHNAATNHTEEDLKEMAHVREGARVLQEKCFGAISQIARSLMLCAAATSGANNNLLSKLRERKNVSVAGKDKAQASANKASASSKNGAKKENDDYSVSSIESDGNMTVTSVSTIGNIVGGIMNKKKDMHLRSKSFDIPPSPRIMRMQPPPSALDADGGIVEYWQTSIAAERRKTAEVPSRPPRSKKSSFRGAMSTPPRQTPVSRKIISPNKSPRRDDASVVSFADDSTKGDPQFSQQVEDILNVAFEIVETKSLKKSLDYLIACNFLTPSARDIASFLRLHQSKIDAVILGDYLGDGGKDVDDAEHFNLIRFNYISAISFVGMNVERG